MALATVFTLCGAPCVAARAETLYDAFKAAVASNPTLGAQRAAVRAGAQDKALAETGFLPSLTASGDLGSETTKGSAPGDPTTRVNSRPRGYGATLSQNLFNGFKTTNSVKREDASLEAARAKLVDVEQKVLIDVATNYVDVLRDRANLEWRRRDRDVLEARAKETRYRFQIGEVTRTDVDQSEASLASSRADLTIAAANLDASEASYQSVVGRRPRDLAPAAVAERWLPRDLSSAVAAAQDEHPAIQAAMSAVRAAEINIDVERAGYAPSLDVTLSADRRWDPEFYPANTNLTEEKAMGRLTIPIFDRGVTTASVRRASELASQKQFELDQLRAETKANVIRDRGVFLASASVISSADARIASSARALQGVELEASAGQRTTLDVLNAQRSLLEARVNREIAAHDRVVAGYRFLAAIGRLFPERLTAADTIGRAPPPPPPYKIPERRAPLDPPGRADATSRLETPPAPAAEAHVSLVSDVKHAADARLEPRARAYASFRAEAPATLPTGSCPPAQRPTSADARGPGSNAAPCPTPARVAAPAPPLARPDASTAVDAKPDPSARADPAARVEPPPAPATPATGPSDPPQLRSSL